MNKQTIDFLKDLQITLKTQDTIGQASPRFWVVRDYKYVPAISGNGDRMSLVIPSNDFSIPVDEYYQDILEDYSEDDFEKQDLEELGELTKNGIYEEVLEWAQKHQDIDSFLVEEKEISFIVKNTLFLTNDEAKAHIKANQHHYTKDVQTYAMTASRSPQVEKLWGILENTNWDNIKEKI